MRHERVTPVTKTVSRAEGGAGAEPLTVDIYTHTYLGRVPMLHPTGKVRPFLLEAQKRGIIFDIGHGS